MKFSKKVFTKLLKMQDELNKIVGVDTLAIFESMDNELIDTWADMYMIEAHLELAECMENFRHKWWSKDVKENPDLHYTIRDMEKVKVELIDSLHFAMSAMIVMYGFDSSVDELAQCRKAYKVNIQKNTSAMFNLLNHMLGCQSPSVFLYFIEKVFTLLDMEESEIEAIYTLKWEANKKRQEEGYSTETKTEADNEAIEQQLRQKKIRKTRKK